MTMAPRLQQYLAHHSIGYDLVPDRPSVASMHATAVGDCLAKSIVLRDRDGYWLAVVPASRRIRLSALRAALGEPVDLASEREVAELFHDCVGGAIPAAGACYGLDVIVDDSIDQQPQLCFEGGDRETLVCMSHAEFARLNPLARHGSFSAHGRSPPPRA